MALKDLLTPQVGFACMIAAALFSMYSTRIPPNAASPLDCPAGLGSAAKQLSAGPHALTSLRIATYNVEWLYDGVDDDKTPYAADPEAAQVCWRVHTAQPPRHRLKWAQRTQLRL